MANSSQYRISSNVSSYSRKPFDSTDRILDEIDAKLVRVTSSVVHQNNIDVNDDPGTDLKSVQTLRQHLEFSPNKVPAHTLKARKTERFDQIIPTMNYGGADQTPEKPVVIKPQNYHSKRTDLLQLYDDDINALRRMLKENIVDASQEEEATQEEVTRQPLNDKPVLHSEVPSSSSDEKIVKWSDQPEEEKENQSFCETEDEVIVTDDPADDTQCSCGCEEELTKVAEERDELKARIRRGEASRTSIQERQELERALHSSKTALFQERKRSRQQLEDIEEKLEEAQHYYEEKLAERDEAIDCLKQKIELVQSTETTVNRQVHHRENSSEELIERDIEIRQLKDISSRQQQEIEALALKAKDTEEETKKTIERLMASERMEWGKSFKEVEEKLTQSNKEKHAQEIVIKELVDEKEKLHSDMLLLNEKLKEFHEELNMKEKERIEEQIRLRNDNKTMSELLKNKIESLKEELVQAFSKNSQLELEMRRRENELVQDYKGRENDMNKRNKDTDEKVEELQKELATVVIKLKEFRADSEHKEQCLSSSIYDECHKLSLLLQAMQPLYNKARNTFTPQSQLTAKKSVCELQDTVELVCRSANEIICEVTRLRRESKKRPDYVSSLRSNSDVSIASEEAKLMREKLREKDDELQQLQLNMNQWKDQTAERLAEKFQEELQLQVERKLAQHKSENLWKLSHNKPEIGKYCNGSSNLPNPEVGKYKGSGHSSTHLSHTSNHSNDTSTVKLLCHLQGRVKQLRTENDMLRSSSFIKGLDNH